MKHLIKQQREDMNVLEAVVSIVILMIMIVTIIANTKEIINLFKNR